MANDREFKPAQVVKQSSQAAVDRIEVEKNPGTFRLRPVKPMVDDLLQNGPPVPFARTIFEVVQFGEYG